MKNYFNSNKVHSIGECQYVIGDCVEALRTMAPNSVNTIVTSPPYNLNKKYGVTKKRENRHELDC